MQVLPSTVVRHISVARSPASGARPRHPLPVARMREPSSPFSKQTRPVNPRIQESGGWRLVSGFWLGESGANNNRASDRLAASRPFAVGTTLDIVTVGAAFPRGTGTSTLKSTTTIREQCQE